MMSQKGFALFIFMLLTTVYRSIAQTTYNVGPTQTYTTIGAVPWYNLQAGDIVNIHYKPTPYREKILISTSGTASQWIKVIGIPNANGDLPIISGDGATTGSNMHWRPNWLTEIQNLGVVSIVAGADGGDNSTPPQYIEIANLQIQDGYRDYSFIGENSTTSMPYTGFTAAIYARSTKHLLVRNNILKNCGQAFYNWTAVPPELYWAGLAADITLRGNYFLGNGNFGEDHEHQTYTEAEGVTIEYNHYGPKRIGALGSQLKDRSAGTVIRYNYFEQCLSGYDMDLVEPQEGYSTLGFRDTYKQAHVYGNVIMNNSLNFTPNYIHWNEDHNGDVGRANQVGSKLLFYDNTIVTIANQSDMPYGFHAFNITFGGYECNPTLLPGVIDVRNNIFATLPRTAGSPIPAFKFALCPQTNFNFSNNWVSPGWTTGSTATVTGANTTVSPADNDPGFLNIAALDVHLLANSSARNIGGALALEVTANYLGLDLTPNQEYVYHQQIVQRTASGVGSNAGAFGGTGVACNYGLSMTNAAAIGPLSINSVNVTASAGCPWTAKSNVAWLTIASGSSGAGDGTVNYSVAENVAAARSGTLTIANQTFTVNQAAAAGCFYSVSPSVATPTFTASSGSVAVTAVAGCAWTASTNVAWITLTNTTGTGDGTVNYAVAENVDGGRSGTITIMNQLVTVNQAAAPGSPIDYYTNETLATVSLINGNGTAEIVAEGLNNSNCLKFSNLGTWDKTMRVHYAVPKDISSVSSSYKLRISVDLLGNAPATNIGVTLNNTFDLIVWTPQIDNSVGFQTFELDVSNAVKTLIGNTVNDIYFQPGTGFPSGSILKIDDIKFIASAPIPCAYILSPSTIAPPSVSATGSVDITTEATCAWTAVSNAPTWLTVTGAASGLGDGTFSYAIAANAGAARVGTISIGSQLFTVNQGATGDCFYSISPTNITPSVSTTTGAITLTTVANCPWTAVSNDAWITITPTNGTGTSTINYTIAANTGGSRNGTVMIQGQLFTVSQASAIPENNIDYYTNETTPTVSLIDGEGVGSIVAQGVNGSNCLKFSGLGQWGKTMRVHYATPKDISRVLTNDKLRISVDLSNNDPATSIAINFNGVYDQLVWTPTLDNTVGFQTFDIEIPSNVRSLMGNTVNDVYFQSGTGFPAGSVLKVDNIQFLATGVVCNYAISPTNVTPSVSATVETINVTTGATCAWTAVSNAPSWLTITSGASGTGNGIVSYSVTENTGIPRSATITIGGFADGQVFTVNQLANSNCVYTLSSNSSSRSKDLSSGSIYLTATTGCSWTAVSNATWLAIISGGSGTGNGTIGFSVAPNTTAIARTGTLSIGGKTYSVTQKGTTDEGTNPAPLIAQFQGDKEAAVIFTFDDTKPSHDVEVRNLFNNYGLKATFYVVTNRITDWSTWQAMDVEGHEIGNHSFSHYLDDFNAPRLQQEIAVPYNDIVAHIGHCYTWAYPFGANNAASDALVAQYHISSRYKTDPTGDYLPYGITYDASGLDGGYATAAKFNQDIDDVIAGKTAWDNNLQAYSKSHVLSTLTHGITVFKDMPTPDPLDIYVLNQNLAYAKSKEDKLWIATYADNFKYWKERNNSTVTVLNTTANSTDFTVTNTLDPSIYFTPLTIIVDPTGNGTPTNVQVTGATATTKVKGDKILVTLVASSQTIHVTWAYGSVLPLELVTFEGKESNNGVQLHWETANEQALSRFIVEKSSDTPDKFVEIGEIKGKGNNGEAPQYYSLFDAQLNTGNSEGNSYVRTGVGTTFTVALNYYRLKMVDNNGTFTYSKILAFKTKSKSTDKIVFYPNPVTNVLNVVLTNTNYKTATVSLVDITGKVLLQQTKAFDNQPFALNVENYGNGIYTAVVTIDGSRSMHKVVIAK